MSHPPRDAQSPVHGVGSLVWPWSPSGHKFATQSLRTTGRPSDLSTCRRVCTAALNVVNLDFVFHRCLY